MRQLDALVRTARDLADAHAKGVFGFAAGMRAPEGGPPTAASDVFALCRMIADAFDPAFAATAPAGNTVDTGVQVVGNAPPAPGATVVSVAPAAITPRARRRMPGPLAVVVQRGLAGDPRARPSLADVITALAPPPASRRRRWPVVVGALVILGAGGASTALLATTSTSADPSCEGSLAATIGAYTDAKRAALKAALERHAGHANAALAAFDARAHALDGEDTARCAAPPDPVRAGCLARRALDLRADVDRVIAASPADTSEVVVPGAAWSLRSPSDCTEVIAPPTNPAFEAPLWAALDALDPTLPVPAEGKAASAIADAAYALHDRELQGWALAETGVTLRRIADYALADQVLVRAFHIATEIHSTALEAFVVSERGRVALYLGNGTDAIDITHESPAYLDKPGMTPRMKARVYFTVGSIEATLSDVPEALDNLDRGLAIFHKGLVDPSIESQTLAAKAHALLWLDNRRDDAEAVARDAIETARVKLPATSIANAIALDSLAAIDDAANRTTDALALRERIFAIYEADAADAPNTITAAVDVDLDRVALGNIAQAHADLVRLDARIAHDESLRQERPAVKLALGIATGDTGDLSGALAILDDAIASATAVFGAGKLETLNARLARVTTQLELESYDEVARALPELAAGFVEHEQADQAALVRDAMGADIALHAGDSQHAEALARHGLATPMQTMLVESELERQLGRALTAQRRYREAATALARASELAKPFREDYAAVIEVDRARLLFLIGDRKGGTTAALHASDVLSRYPGRMRARAELLTVSTH